MKISINKRHYIGFASVVLMLIIWKLLSLHFRSDFILPSPEKSLISALGIVGDLGFLKVVGATIMRGFIGFIIAGLLGIIAGIFAGLSPNFNAFMAPFIVTVRSTPVVAFILLALIWFTSDSVPIFIAILTMFPIVYSNVVEGINNVDGKLVEMAIFYKVNRKRIVGEVYVPAIMPFLVSGFSTAVGIGWRAIIVGEVLSQPKYGIGTDMHAAQLFLNVEALIAWTVIAVIFGWLFEKLIRTGESKIVVWRGKK